MAFNPDDYLKKKKVTRTGFNPDLYLQKKKQGEEIVSNVYEKAPENYGEQEAERRAYNKVIGWAGQKKPAPVLTDLGAQFGSRMANQMTGGLPEILDKNIIPPATTAAQKTMGGLGTIAGIGLGLPMMAGRAGVNLLTSAIPQLASKKLLPTMGRIAAEGGLTGATMSPESTENQLQRRAVMGAGGAIAGGTLPGVGKGFSLAGRFLEKNVGGIADSTIATIKRLGANRVFSPEKADTEYIGKSITPRLQDKIGTSIEKNYVGTDNILVKLGVPKEDAKLITQLDPTKRKMVADVARGKITDVDSMVENQMSAAKKFYKQTIDNIPNDTDIFSVNLKNTYYSLKNELKQMGWVDEAGNALSQKNSVSNTTRDKLLMIYENIKTDYKNNIPVSKTRYLSYLNDLEASIGGTPKFDRLVYSGLDKMKSDFNASIKTAQANLEQTVPNSQLVLRSLDEANKQYANAKTLEQITKALTRLGDERVPFNVVLQNTVKALGDPAKYQQRQIWKNIMGNNLFDDMEAHFANRDYGLTSNVPGSGGGIYPSRSGALRVGVSELSKAYRKRANVLPVADYPEMTGTLPK